jgi:uncharacterized BrkB/YihY/UPF0761 family membrane protein
MAFIELGATVGAKAIAGLFPMASVSSLLVGAAVMVTLLVLLYRFVPTRTFKLREVLPGALLGGVLIEVLSLGFPQGARDLKPPAAGTGTRSDRCVET